jgi:hypothetical protein
MLSWISLLEDKPMSPESGQYEIRDALADFFEHDEPMRRLVSHVLYFAVEGVLGSGDVEVTAVLPYSAADSYYDDDEVDWADPRARIDRKLGKAFRLLTDRDLRCNRVHVVCVPDAMVLRQAGLNQCFFLAEATVEHDGLLFRSEPEIRIYDELRQREVMFLPNPAAVLHGEEKPKEPDFLVCSDGHWGILEVFGDRAHNGNAAKDHDRMRLFKKFGVMVVEAFSARQCCAAPAKVVDEFLAILGRCK